MSGAPVLFSLLFDRVKRTKTGIARGRKDHIGAFANLGQRKLLTLSRVVPCAVCYPNVVLNDANVRVNSLGAFFVSLLKTMNQANVHASEKTDRPRSGCFRRQHTNKVRPFLLLEYQRGNIR